MVSREGDETPTGSPAVVFRLSTSGLGTLESALGQPEPGEPGFIMA